MFNLSDKQKAILLFPQKIWKWFLSVNVVIYIIISVGLGILNIATVTSAKAFAIMSGIVGTLTRSSTVLASHIDEKKLLQKQFLDTKSELNRNQTKLKATNAKLNASKSSLTKTKSQLQRTTKANAALKKSVRRTTSRVIRRTTVGASRNVVSTFAESIPLWGVTVVVGVTALELKEACDTAKDMQELNLAFNPELTSEETAQEVCGMSVPSMDEIWTKIKDSPDDIKSSLDNMPDLTLPSYDDVLLSTANAWQSTLDRSHDAYRATASASQRAWERAKSWYPWREEQNSEDSSKSDVTDPEPGKVASEKKDG